MEQRSVKLLPFSDRHDAPLLILLVSVLGRVQYQVFTLWNEGVSDYYYGDDEYLHLAKVLSEKKVYLTLEAAKDVTENALRMSVYSNDNEYQRNITFRGGSEFKWIEPLISGVEDIGNDDDQYITAIAPEWMAHIASWLDDDKNLHENREHQVQPGPDFITDKYANNPRMLTTAGNGCIQLEMSGKQLKLPEKMIIDGEKQCFGITGSNSSEHWRHSITYNRVETDKLLLADKSWKWASISLFNLVAGLGINQFQRGLGSWQKSRFVSTEVQTIISASPGMDIAESYFSSPLKPVEFTSLPATGVQQTLLSQTESEVPPPPPAPSTAPPRSAVPAKAAESQDSNISSNKDTADKDTADKDTADKDTADKDTADKDTADKDTADKDTADKDTADKDTADTEIMHRQITQGVKLRRVSESDRHKFGGSGKQTNGNGFVITLDDLNTARLKKPVVPSPKEGDNGKKPELNEFEKTRQRITGKPPQSNGEADTESSVTTEGTDEQ